MKMIRSENGQTSMVGQGIVKDMERLDPGACYRAIQTRDRRFDGRLFVAVTSTGVYCRPICPARTPKYEHCRFFQTAAAAQEAGFRACLRCRPEISPELAGWQGTATTVSRALSLIAEGFLDQSGAGVDTLANRLGMGGRQLRRLFEEHLGASPSSVAQTRRVLFAKQLLHETQLSMTDVAMASGFGSVRRFNDAFRAQYRRPPSELRQRRLAHDPRLSSPPAITLHVPYQPPYDWSSMLAYLNARAIEGVEEVRNGCYRRTVSLEGSDGVVEVANDPVRQGLTVSIQFPSVRALPVIVLRIRRMFDLYADVNRIGTHLSHDPALARLIAQRPGLRAPGAWDGFELAVRAVLGQQISVEAARQLAGKLVRECNQSSASLADGSLTCVFPSPSRLAAADLSALGMPNSRKKTLKILAEAAMRTPHLFEPVGSVEEAMHRLRAIPGIGEWTAQYIALRALRETDAFPATDVGILRGAMKLDGMATTAEKLMGRAERWRPWRAYAAQHLWAAGAAPVSKVNGGSHA